MANKRVLALRKQLKREQLHVKWLEQHLPNSPQLNSAQQRIAQLCVLECVVETATLPLRDAATKKSDAEAPLSLYVRVFRLECEVQTDSCQVAVCTILVVHCCESRRTTTK